MAVENNDWVISFDALRALSMSRLLELHAQYSFFSLPTEDRGVVPAVRDVEELGRALRKRRLAAEIDRRFSE